MEVDRYIGPIFGSYWYVGIGQNGRFKIVLSRCLQNTVTFLTHADNLRKKAQRTK